MDEQQAEPVRAQLANGDTLEFPPGTPEAVVTATVKKHIAEHAPKSAMEQGADFAKGVVSDMVTGPLETAKGVAKGIGQTAADVGKTANTLGEKVFGRKMLPEGAVSWADQQLAPENGAQRAGKTLEQIAEYAAPGAAADAVAGRVAAKVGGGALLRVGARSAANAAANAGMAALHGEDPTTGAALGAVLPVVGEGIAAAGRGLADSAPSLVRRGLKPVLSDLKRVPGASRTGVEQQAQDLANFILQHRLTTGDKAANLVTDLEGQIGQKLSGVTNPTDAAQRAWQYLDDLAKNAQTTEQVNAIRSAQQELLNGTGRLGKELSEDVTKTVNQPLVINGKPLLNPQGRPITTAQQVTTRQLRTDVPASQAFDLARNQSKWATTGQYGAQKGADVEAAKAVDRALRDSVKDTAAAAGSDVAPLLKTQGGAIRAGKALDRMELREGNKSPIGLEGALGAAAATAKGNFLGLAAQWLNRNAVRAGVYSDLMAKAIANGDAQTVARVFGRLGIGVAEVYPQASEQGGKP